MLNEGIILNSTPASLRSEMVRQIHRLGEATPDTWERAVFESLVGATREDVDWDFEDNQAGYYTWLKAFDQYAQELVDDGFVEVLERDGASLFVARETDPAIDWSALNSTSA
jgi:hypothetical protein